MADDYLSQFNKVNPNKKDKTAPYVEFLPGSPFPITFHKKDMFFWFARNFFYEMALTHDEHEELVKNLSLVIKAIEEQNRAINLQNKLIRRLLESDANDENGIIIPQIMQCPNCRKEFYSTNKSYFENKKCPHCDIELTEDIIPLKIKKTERIEEGTCPYCGSDIHTNDLICPICYEKLTPIYDELLEEKLRKEKEKRERDDKFLWDNEEELFEEYSKLVINQNYSEEKAKKEIIIRNGISNLDLLDKICETKKWDERLKTKLNLKEQADTFLKEREDELFETYENLITNEGHSIRDAKEEILKKYNITNPYIIEKFNAEIWGKWNRKIEANKRLRETKMFKTYCEIILDEKQSTDTAMKRIAVDYNITTDDLLKMKKSNDWDNKLIDEKKKREEQEKNKYLKSQMDYQKSNTKPCPICGKTNNKDSRFCTYCQHDFSKERKLTKFTKLHEKKACPMCKYYNEVDFNYCKSCGYKFPAINNVGYSSNGNSTSKICPKCGVENGLDSNFCIDCGNKL